jgi:calcium-dependent protein kinase
MLADKLEVIEELLKKAAQDEANRAAEEAEAAKGKAEVLDVQELDEKPGGRRSFSYKVSDGFDTRHTQGHPKDVYEIVEHLGDGDTSTVWGGWHTESMRSVAIKTEGKSDEAGIWDEINIMRKIKHNNISSLYETFENETQVFMVLELCSGGRLYDAIGLSQGDKKAITTRHPGVLKQLVDCVAFLHQNQICHRDIQLENFLLDKPVDELHKATLKLIDFTTAKDYGSGQELVTKVCTPIYVAREILTRRIEPYTEKVDIWSLGVLFFILVSGHPPFAGSTDFDILKKVKKANWSFEPAKIWKDASEEVIDLISKMIVADAGDRLSAQEVLSHPFLKNA